MPFLIAQPQFKITTQPSDWQEFSIADFSGGLCTAFPDSAIRDNQFSTLLNFYHEKDGGLKVRGPYRPVDVASVKESIIPDSAAPLTFTWIELGGTDFLIACWDNGSNYEVSYWDSSNDRWAGEGGGTSIKTDLTDAYKAKYVKFSVNDAEDLIFCNGKDTPQRWLGSAGASTDLGLAAPSDTTTLAVAESAAADQRGIQYDATYHYKFTAFYDSSGTNTKYGESGPTASDSIAITGADVSADTTVVGTLSNCPAIPTGATKNYVYRAPPGESNGPYERVGYYSSGTGFVDAVPVGEEGIEAPADAGTPPRLKNPLSFKERIWGIGTNASGALTNKGVWSEESFPDMFLAANYVYFPHPLAGPVAFNEDLYWFTEQEIYKVPKADISTYSKPIKICDIGCSSYDSITDVGNGLIWQYDKNIWWADFNTYNEKLGDFPFPIGEPVKDKIEDIPSGYEGNSVGCFHKGKYYFSYTSTGTANNATLVWDVNTGTRLLTQGLWGAWTELDIKANWFDSHDGTLYSADPDNKYVMEHDFSGTADFHNKTEYDAGTNYDISTDLRTKLLHFGQEESRKLISSVSAVAESSGATYSAVIQLNDNTFSKSQTLTLGSTAYAAGSSNLYWDIGTWNNFNWAAETSAFRSSHKKFPRGAKGRNAKLVFTSLDSEDTKLILLKLYYKVLPIPA